MALPLSLYVHIPFCESLCFYCACNKIVTKRHEQGSLYLRYLARELALHVTELGTGQRISLHTSAVARRLSSVMRNWLN